MRPSLTTRLRAAVQRFIQTRVFGMDIDTSAWIEPTALIDRTFPRGVHIGPDVHIAQESVVLTHDFSRGMYLHTRIGARCHLGARSIIMPGVTVGADCVVAPGALVVKDLPPGSHAMGNPARVTPREDLGGGPGATP
jgi:acetyltransferase-like isoleucine patch superfamily enzyme